MAQIAFDLEIRIKGKCRRCFILQLATEFAMQSLVRKISDMRGHARHGEPFGRVLTKFKIASIRPIRISHDGLAPDFIEGDILRGMAGRGRNRDRAKDALWIARHPLQHLHAAHRPADDAEQFVDAQLIYEQRLRADHVADCHHRHAEPVKLACCRIGGSGPGCPKAAAEHIRADDEIAVRIDGLAGPDHYFPPAGLAGQRMGIGDMLVPGQRMADQNGIGFVGIERAIGLIGDG